ncbi:MAG: hypothetical protein L6R35_002783 [Caloplaca aegaea]|nr:MAG: hypothetical protein L6R35_002783 [Caloplaca aegaea]
MPNLLKALVPMPDYAGRVTETVFTAANPPSSSLSPSVASAGIATSIEPTTTLSSTSYLTRTRVVEADDAAVPLPAQTNAAQGGYYYYAVDNGTTIWLGTKTPAFGATVATNTVVVTVHPQPEYTGVPVADTTIQSSETLEDEASTSMTTLHSTSFHTRYLTMELTHGPTPTSRSSVRLPPYLASYGWNTTLSIAQGTGGFLPVSASSDMFPAISPTWPASGIAASTPSYTIKRHHPRQVGAVVSVTMNGVVVSWTNSYDGVPATLAPVSSSQASPSSVAVTTLESDSTPDYSWVSSPVSSTSVAAPRSQPSTPSSAIEPLSTQQSAGSTSSAYSIVQATPSFSNATGTGSTSPSAATSFCGSDTGLFTITVSHLKAETLSPVDHLQFDDLPHFSTESPLSSIPPIFNPYRKLFFNSGYGYVPPPSDPFPPISPPQLAVYNYHNDSVSQTSVDDGLVLHGEIGAGPRVNESAYWIDAYSTWIGCANGGPGECTINFIGYDRFNNQVAHQTVLQAACPGLVNCKLAQVSFADEFRELAGLQILAYVDETPVTFYMDDLSVGWSNNSCAARLERSSHE